MHSTAPKKILKSALYASRRIKNQFPVIFVASVINSINEKVLCGYNTVASVRMTFGPFINTVFTPVIAGFFFGAKGLIFMVRPAEPC